MDGNLVRHMILLNFSARDAVGRWFAPMIVTPQMNVEYVKRLKVLPCLERVRWRCSVLLLELTIQEVRVRSRGRHDV
jgi:hypothetical protein